MSCFCIGRLGFMKHSKIEPFYIMFDSSFLLDNYLQCGQYAYKDRAWVDQVVEQGELK